MTILDQEELHGLNIGCDDREAMLLASDIMAVIQENKLLKSKQANTSRETARP